MPNGASWGPFRYPPPPAPSASPSALRGAHHATRAGPALFPRLCSNVHVWVPVFAVPDTPGHTCGHTRRAGYTPPGTLGVRGPAGTAGVAHADPGHRLRNADPAPTSPGCRGHRAGPQGGTEAQSCCPAALAGSQGRPPPKCLGPLALSLLAAVRYLRSSWPLPALSAMVSLQFTEEERLLGENAAGRPPARLGSPPPGSPELCRGSS